MFTTASSKWRKPQGINRRARITPRTQTLDQWRATLTAYKDRPHSPNSARECDQTLEERALVRLANGDVSATRFGIRVALRRELNDQRVDANAYWPLAKAGCRCFQAKKNDGLCSHWLAARLFVFARKRRHQEGNDAVN